MDKVLKKVTIVGAGMAGLGCSYTLSKLNPEIKVTILEKARKVGGRTTSNIRDDMTYDHGANYFNFEGLSNPEAIKNILTKELPTSELSQISKDIYLFDKDSNIIQSTAIQSEKWTYSSGILKLGQLIQQTKNLDVNLSALVTRLSFNQEQRKWNVFYKNDPQDQNEQSIDSECVLLTPPAPQIVDLLKKSDYQKKDALISILDKAQYTKQIVFVVAFKEEVSFPFAALLNQDRQHDVSWISIENEKAGHVPKGHTVLVCQMSPKYSDSRYFENDDVLKAQIKEILNKLLPQVKEAQLTEKVQFLWIKKWKYSLPIGPAIQEEELKEYQADGIFFAGDFLIGRGRVLQAMEKGINIASDIKARL